MSTAKDTVTQPSTASPTSSRLCPPHPRSTRSWPTRKRGRGWLTEFLAGKGFKVEGGVAGVDTAFRAPRDGEGPTIAIMCEYDALPGIGHACGHNVIAASGAGAGAALALAKGVVPRGRIQVIRDSGGRGRRREEPPHQGRDLQGRGLRHDDPRLRPHHPASGSAGIVRGTFEFQGKASHASADPWEGVNALEPASGPSTR
jgi:hypothetical protein